VTGEAKPPCAGSPTLSLPAAVLMDFAPRAERPVLLSLSTKYALIVACGHDVAVAYASGIAAERIQRTGRCAS
jgi:hypothetical protein